MDAVNYLVFNIFNSPIRCRSYLQSGGRSLSDDLFVTQLTVMRLLVSCMARSNRVHYLLDSGIVILL